MKVVMIFLTGILEAIKMSFSKPETEDKNFELELPSDEVLKMNKKELEVWNQTVLLDTIQDYNVNVFTHWFLLASLVFTSIFSIYQFCTKQPICILFLIISIVLFKLHYNRKCMAEAKRCLINMSFTPPEEMGKYM
jgi:hypothetical protein